LDHWLFVNFGQFFENYKTFFWLLFSAVLVTPSSGKNGFGYLYFERFFSQTHLVTLGLTEAEEFVLKKVWRLFFDPKNRA
jgi:hypothetical protein